MNREILFIILVLASLLWFIYKFFYINIKKTYNTYEKAIKTVQQVLTSKICKEEFFKQREQISKRTEGWYIPVIPLITFLVLYVGIIIIYIYP